MIRRMNEGLTKFTPDAGLIRLTKGVSRNQIGKEAADIIFDALDHGDIHETGTAYWVIGTDDKYMYAIVLGLDDDENVCMKWGYMQKRTGFERGEIMTEYMDFMYPYTDDGTCCDNEIMIIARDNFGINFPASIATRAATELYNDFTDYVDAHNAEYRDYDFDESVKRKSRKKFREDAISDREVLRSCNNRLKEKIDGILDTLKLTAWEYLDEIEKIEDDDRYAYEATNIYATLKNANTELEKATRSLRK